MLSSFNDRAKSVRLSPADGTEPPPATATKKILHNSTGSCLTAPSLSSETALTTSRCANQAGQRFEISGATIKVAGTTNCLDVVGGSTSNGARVQSYACHGGANQAWEVRSDATIRNPQSGKCLTRQTSWFIPPSLVISTCYGYSSQKWTVSST